MVGPLSQELIKNILPSLKYACALQINRTEITMQEYRNHLIHSPQCLDSLQVDQKNGR